MKGKSGFPVWRHCMGSRMPDFFRDASDDNWLFSHEGRHPVVDVKEEDGQYTLEVELPGLEEKDIGVQVENRVLTISTVKSEERKDEERSQRRSFAFKRSFHIPEGVEEEEISAKLDKGLLRVTLPKGAKAQPRSIAIG